MPDRRMEEDHLYLIALLNLPGIGPQLGRVLVDAFGSARAVLHARRSDLELIEGVGQQRLSAVLKKADIPQAERVLQQCREKKVGLCHYLEPEFPGRLKGCLDAPLLLYYRGRLTGNEQQSLGVVGTRHATPHGKRQANRLVNAFSGSDTSIISGLALGIDGAAHSAALASGLPTAAILAHGLHMIYPPAHRKLSHRILDAGGCLLSEYPWGTPPERYHFPARNRIIAGMSDAVLVVESAERGGALLTAGMAASYHREVFAVPGRPEDHFSTGCNAMIRQQMAVVATSGKDVMDWMGWSGDGKSIVRGLDLSTLGEAESMVVRSMRSLKGRRSAVEIALDSGLEMGVIHKAVLSLEFKGWLVARPGNTYELA